MKILRYEIRLWAALFRWIFRRPIPVPPSTRRFPYHRAVAMILWAFLAVSVIEIPILELILPWEPVRVVALIISVYSVFWMIGLMGTMHVYPHLVGPAGLSIRKGATFTLDLPWADVAKIRSRPRSLPPGGQTQFEDGVLSFGAAGGTTVDVVLARPLTLPVKKTGGEPVTEVRFHADTPEELAEAANAFLRAEVD